MKVVLAVPGSGLGSQVKQSRTVDVFVLTTGQTKFLIIDWYKALVGWID